MTRTGV